MTLRQTVGKLSLVALLGLGLSTQVLTSAYAEGSSEATTAATAKKEDGSMKALVGEFKGGEKTKVLGIARVTANELTLANFSTDEGPDLHAYLTKDGDIKSGVDLGKIDQKAKLQSLKLKDVDPSKYNTVTIYCNEAHATFGEAKLMKLSELKADAAKMRAGEFMTEKDHMVKGKLKVEGNQLSLMGFSSDKGPDLHAILTKDGNLETGVDLGAVDAEKAEQTFDLNGQKADDYNKLVIYCVEAHAVFGSAELK